MPKTIRLFGSNQTPYDGYATSLEALCYAANLTWGNIIEFGLGYYSTPVLYQLAKIRRTEYTGWETSKEWARLFQNRYPAYWVKDFSEIEPRETGLVFIDGDVKPTNRQQVMERWIDHADIIVCHDTEKKNAKKYGPYDFSKVKYKKVFDWQFPETTILSNKIRL